MWLQQQQHKRHNHYDLDGPNSGAGAAAACAASAVPLGKVDESIGFVTDLSACRLHIAIWQPSDVFCISSEGAHRMKKTTYYDNFADCDAEHFLSNGL